MFDALQCGRRIGGRRGTLGRAVEEDNVEFATVSDIRSHQSGEPSRT